MSSGTTLQDEPNAANSATKCTCGHNYGSELLSHHNDKDPTQEGACQQRQSTSSDRQNEFSTDDNKNMSLPLDTSFVQIPMMMIHNSTQRTNHHTISRKIMANHDSLENETNHTFEKSSGKSSSCNVHYTNCVAQLYRAVSSTTDSLPSLCQECVQRYAFLYIIIRINHMTDS